MCDVYGEACFSEKNTYKWDKQGFSTTNLNQKCILSNKEKVPGVAIRKERLFVCLFGFYGISSFVGYLMPNPFLYKWTFLFQVIQFIISSIWPIDRTLSGATSPGQSGPGSDSNKGVLYIPQSSSITGTAPADCLVSYRGRSSCGGGLTSLQRCNRYILQPKPIGQCKECHADRHYWFHWKRYNCKQCLLLATPKANFTLFTEWPLYFVYHHHHHHHVVLVARISLTLSRHSSLSFIALGRSSGQHPVSSHSCWMYVRAGRPAFAQPCVGVSKSTSLMSSSLLLQQCPACLIRLTWIVFVIGCRWPYSWCLVGCCRQDLFKIARSILV